MGLPATLSAFPPPRASTRAASRAELRQAAQDASRRSFLRMVSHELRTPLNAVIGFSELIAGELHGPINEPRYVEHARMVRDSGLKLLGLVNQVIEVARLESGAVDLAIRAEPVGEVIDEVFAAMAEAAAAASVRLVREVEAAAPERVLADRRGLGSVLQALISNAIAASPSGGAVTLAVRAAPQAVVFEVRDEGSGVDPQDLPRLMRPFEQGESALIRHSTGAGLGLPIAQLLCEAMQGRLRLRAEPGCGLMARVRLPAAA